MNETRKQSSCDVVVPLRPNETVVATVSLLAFIGAVVLLLVALMSPTLSGPSLDITLVVSASLALMVPAFACIFFRCRARLVLSETGLRWRTWGDWRRTIWNGVQDYCDLPPRTGSSGRLMTIQTNAGDVLLSRKWRESEAVRQAVQTRATEAAVTEWGVQGERSHATDTRTFRYGQKDFWSTLLLGGGFSLPYTAYGWYWILHQPGSRHLFAGIWTPGDFWDSLITIVLFTIIMLGGLIIFNLPLLIFLALLPGMLEAWKRRGERITTRQSGIMFEDSRRKISADWDEVAGYFLQPSAYARSPFFCTTALSSSPLLGWRWVYIVETQHETFEYSAQIEDKEALGKIIKERAMPIQVRDDLNLPMKP